MLKCPGKKDHRIKDDTDYLFHVAQCPFVSSVPQMFACKFEPLHMFRTLREKRSHEPVCLYGNRPVKLHNEDMVDNPFFKSKKKPVPNIVQFSLPSTPSQRETARSVSTTETASAAENPAVKLPLRLMLSAGGSSIVVGFDMSLREGGALSADAWEPNQIIETQPALSGPRSVPCIAAATMRCTRETTAQAREFVEKHFAAHPQLLLSLQGAEWYLRPSPLGLSLELFPLQSRRDARRDLLEEKLVCQEEELAAAAARLDRLRQSAEAARQKRAQTTALEARVLALRAEEARLQSALALEEAAQPSKSEEIDRLVEERKRAHFASYRARVVPLFEALVLWKNKFREEVARAKELSAAGAKAEEALQAAGEEARAAAEREEALRDRAAHCREEALLREKAESVEERAAPKPRALSPFYFCAFCAAQPKTVVFLPCLCNVMCIACFKLQTAARLSACLLCLERIDDYLYVEHDTSALA